MKGRLCGTSDITVMNIGLRGAHPNGEDGAFEYLDRRPII